jgi:hypothetical protein
MKRPIFLLSVAALALSAQAFANSTQILVMSRAVGGAAAPMKVELDDSGNLLGLLVFSPDPNIPADHYSIDQIRKGADIAVTDDKGTVHHGLFSLKAPDVDPATGGSMTVRWTQNVILSKHGEKTLRIAKGDDSQWHLYEGQTLLRELSITPGTFGISNVAPVAILAGDQDQEKLLAPLEGSKGSAFAAVESEPVVKTVSNPQPSPTLDLIPAVAPAASSALPVSTTQI